jgi:hypothetical protein
MLYDINRPERYQHASCGSFQHFSLSVRRGGQYPAAPAKVLPFRKTLTG